MMDWVEYLLFGVGIVCGLITFVAIMAWLTKEEPREGRWCARRTL